ncbi:MAG: phosphate signaling complex protein PhoU [Desulfobulbaceae bacterium]|nr:phosphate signaling complex protein PhoU [Desulfobulbaceae bacterium]HIJ78771.1 phosphate signaling complex protein PhoU [Deltaproteobacteria bacterium]
MAKNIQAEIAKVKNNILYLGATVEENIHKAVKSLLTRDVKMAREVIRRDKEEIDCIEINVEEECMRILALHQPVASDLRFLVTVLKINTDLERIGDLAAKIADKVVLLSEMDPARFVAQGIQMPEVFSAMFDKTIWMYKKTLDAFVNEDTDLAYKVCLADDEVDRAKRTIRDQLEEIIMQDSRQHVYLGKQLSVARSLERIADHCTSICEDIIYMMQGRIVRHHNVR